MCSKWLKNIFNFPFYKTVIKKTFPKLLIKGLMISCKLVTEYDDLVSKGT